MLSQRDTELPGEPHGRRTDRRGWKFASTMKDVHMQHQDRAYIAASMFRMRAKRLPGEEVVP